MKNIDRLRVGHNQRSHDREFLKRQRRDFDLQDSGMPTDLAVSFSFKIWPSYLFSVSTNCNFAWVKLLQCCLRCGVYADLLVPFMVFNCLLMFFRWVLSADSRLNNQSSFGGVNSSQYLEIVFQKFFFQDISHPCCGEWKLFTE